MSKGFKATDESAEEEYNKKRKEEDEENSSVNYRVRITEGNNCLWVLPRYGEMPSPFMKALIHYRPFHRCGRKDPYIDPETGEEKTDKFFSNCYRCQKAWNTWEEIGQGSKDNPHPTYEKRNEDLENEQVAFQAIDFSSFFDTDSDGDPVLNEDRVERWMEDFVDVMQQEQNPDVDEVEVPDDMPEKMEEHARAGVSIVCVNTDLGKNIKKTHKDETKRRKGNDPLLTPEKTLINIHVEKKDETFESRGQKRYKRAYHPSFIFSTAMEGFSVPDELSLDGGEVIRNQVVDLADPDVPEDADVVEKASNFCKLTDEEIEEFLNETGHSFYVEGHEPEAASVETDDSDDFADEDTAYTQEDKQELEEMKKEMKE